MENLQSWCLLPLLLLLLETVLALSQDWIGGFGLLAVDGYVMFRTFNWLKSFALELTLAPPTVVFAKPMVLVSGVAFLCGWVYVIWYTFDSSRQPIDIATTAFHFPLTLIWGLSNGLSNGLYYIGFASLFGAIVNACYFIFWIVRSSVEECWGQRAR